MKCSHLHVSFKARLKRLIEVVSAIVALCVLPSFLLAQVNQGRLLGTVTDQSGGVIVGATVTVTDVQKNVSRTLTTDSAGEYVAPNLDPDAYTLRVESRGFKTFTREGMQLGVGQDARVDVTLQPGEQTQTVTVTEALPLIETTTATLTGTIDNQTANEVPLNGRNYINLLSLRPGFVNAPGGGATKQTAMGMRENDNFFLVDGVNNYDWATNQQVINGYALAGDAATLLPIDAIQEMNTEQIPKAEFGWKPGVQVNVGLKSGTNTFHGSAYAYGRDGAWDAKNFFQPSNVPSPPLSFQQFGATAGGPLKKDKIFWFLGFEGQKLYLGVTPLINSPVDASVGDPSLSMVDACNALGRANVNALSAKLAGLPAGSCTPSPTTASFENLFPTNPGTQFAGSPQSVVPSGLFYLSDNNSTYSGLAKVDYHPNEKNTVSGMFFIGQGYGQWDDNPGAITAPWSETDLPFQNRVGSGSWTWTPNSAWVNEVKVGYTHVYAPDLSADRNANPASPWGLSNGLPTGYGINTGETSPAFFGLPLIYITGFTNLGGGNWPRFVGPSAYTEFLDHISYLSGKHAFKFGGEVTLVGTTGAQVHDPKGRINFKPSAPTDPIQYTSLENFLLGNVGSGSTTFVGQPVRNLHDQNYALFLQDDYRVRPTLTVNLGLRYELQTVLTDANNLLGNFDPNTSTGFVQVGKGETSPYNGDHSIFSPRIGLAWDVRGNAKTVIRAGASILHEFAPINQIRNQLGNVPTGAVLSVGGVTIPNNGTIASGNVFPDPVMTLTPAWQSNGATPIFAGAGQLTCSDSAPCATTAFSRNLRIPYFVSWSLDVQRMLTNNLSLEVTYLGNHGVKLLGLQDLNAPPLGSGGTPLPYAQFPYLSYINYMSNMYRSHYNAMQVVLTQRTSHGLSLTAAYTYGHATDDMSANDANVPLDNANPGLQYGNSDYDIRHRFTMDVTYALPSRKSPGQILEGWEIGSIVTLQTGTPWSPQDMSNDFSETGEVNNPFTYGETWNFYGNTRDFQANPNGIPFFSGMSNGVPVPFPSQCVAHASMAQLSAFGCYMKGSSVLVPPEFGTFGTAPRNLFNEAPFRTWDFSILKNWRFKERLTAQFRAEFFNVLNHPVFGSVDAGHLANNDPSVGSNTFGASNETADQAAGDPVLGSGANRVIQLGLKLSF